MTTEQPMMTPRHPPARRTIWQRWRMWLFFLLIVAGLVGYWQWQAWQDRVALETVLAQWDATGTWRWKDWLASRVVPPDHENGAGVLVRIDQLWPRQVETDETVAMMSELEYAPQHGLHAEQAKVLLERMKRCEAAMALLPEFYTKQQFVWPISADVSPVSVPMISLDMMRRTMNRIHDQLEVELHLRHQKQAFEQLRYGWRIPQALNEQLIMLGRLVQTALIHFNCRMVQRWLALSEPNDAELAEIQQLIAPWDETQSWKKMLRTEAGCIDQMIRELQQGKHNLSALVNSTGNNPGDAWWRRISQQVMDYVQSSQMLSARQHAECLELMLRVYQRADAPWREQQREWQAINTHVQQTLLGQLRLYHVLFPTKMMVGGYNELKMAAQLRAVQIALAAERFRKAHGRWPATQEELLGKYLKRMMDDPYDDKPLHMKRVEDGLIVYSLGRNGVDDQGDVLESRENGMPKDVGIRLWDVTKRRQSALPLPDSYLEMQKKLKIPGEEKQP